MLLFEDEARGRTRREQRAELQRARVLRAMAEVVAEHGYGGATIAAVSKRAFVSRATFGVLFGSVEECFAALVGVQTERAAGEVWRAFEPAASWPEGVLASLEALLVLLDLDLALARITLVEALASPTVMSQHWPRLAVRLGKLFYATAESLPGEGRPPRIVAEATVVSVVGVLRNRLIAGQAPPFTSLLGDLASVVVCPYLGPVAAVEVQRLGELRARELMRAIATGPVNPPPGRTRGDGAPLPKPLSHTSAHVARAVVRYVAEHPEASNSTIARATGISHQGQASDLLARLHRAGILTKQQTGGAGRPNAWRLTPQGEEAAQTLALRGDPDP